MTEVNPEQIDAMKDMQTCAVSNAIESLGVRPRTEGFMSPDIKSMFVVTGKGKLIRITLSRLDAMQFSAPRELFNSSVLNETVNANL